jgi:protocatechuate 3,4-dioxygenase beta subunit
LQVWQQRFGRRRLLQWAASTAGLVACGGEDDETERSQTGNGDGSCSDVIPPETAGPYPGDGTNANGTNALTLQGIQRSDIRASVAGATGTASGVLLEVRLTIRDANCTPLGGYAVYIWHCDREGRYSMYSAGAEDENYCRGVQETDDEGVVAFTTIFPACYPGRWPHIHFEVYASLAAATSGANAVATSQLALPEASCDEVFAVSGYEASVNSLAALSLATDGVFRDGAELQLASVTGGVSEGFAAALAVTITP